MSDSQAALNKRAFDDVVGDPYAVPEPIDGFYNRFRTCSTMGSQRYNFDEGHGTGNAARPSQLDFVCDVERIIQEAISDTFLLNKFVTTYIVGDIDSHDSLSQSERSVIEQHVGKLFRAYKVSPVGEYFTTIRTGSTDKR